MGCANSGLPPPPEASIKANMVGYVDPNFKLEDKLTHRQLVMPYGNYKGPVNDEHMKSNLSPQSMTVHNARLLQTPDVNKVEFFHKHGFVLLNKRTKVKDWNTEETNKESDITKIYHGEVEELIRNELFPAGHPIKEIEQPHGVLRRGKNSKMNFYALGIHQDYGDDPLDYQGAIGAYSGPEAQKRKKDQFDDEGCTGMSVICFWRPINMEAPLLHNPLAVLDCSTVELTDLVKTEVYGYTNEEYGPKPQPQLFPKLNPKHKWYYYPDMTNDEILVFKQFEFHKGDNAETPHKCCFHSAVPDPRAGWFVEKRQSTEHRVQVYFGQ